MENTELTKAIEDVDLIKGIMERAAVSLVGFSPALLWWGGSWLALVIILSLLSAPLQALTPRVGHDVETGVYLLTFLLLLAAFAVLVLWLIFGLSTYRAATANPAVSSLTRGLVSVWGVAILISLVLPIFFALIFGLHRFEALAGQIMTMNFGATDTSVELFSGAGLYTPFAHAMEIWLFALALYATRVFARIDFAGWLAGAFLLIGMLYPVLGADFGSYFYPGPYALVLLGGYLELQRRKAGAG